jgi:aspartate-semialdehyde dehydrogenase
MTVSMTCVRVPVYVGHAHAANIRFSRSMTKAEAVEVLSDAPGVQLVDDGDGYPTPLESAGVDPVLVGRVREDPSEPGSLNIWVTGDNLRKGAALNSVQIAELLARG